MANENNNSSPPSEPSPPQMETEAPAKRSWIWRILQYGVNICAVVFVLMVLFGDWIGTDLIRLDTFGQKNAATYIVVLGGDWERAVEGANLYRLGWGKKLIVTSFGQDANELARVAESYGVPRVDILIDGNAHRTADHPHTITALKGVDPATQSFIIVTSAYHTKRARACFEHAGYNNIRMTAPSWRLNQYGLPHHTWTERVAGVYPKLYEYLAWLYYRASGLV